ncbi:MAG: folate-binding protein [Gammaproteobacteria bacterium]|nr:folate-binding protein [Gammaproteobacteria bacterium]
MPDKSVGEKIKATRLEGFQVLVISGSDHVEFLQGQLTQDLATLKTSGTSLAGWASAKGRLLAAGQLIAAGDEIWWPLPADIIKGVAKRLQMFVLRADVKIVISTTPISGLFGLDGQDQLRIAGESVQIGTGPTRLADHSLVVGVVGDPDRAWLIGPTAETTRFKPADESTWILQSIRTGLPFIVATTQELFIPQMLNLDLIGAISFDKGCYVGQEIVARTQNLGRIKRRMYRFTTDQATNLPPGAGLYGPGNATGKVVIFSEQGTRGELLAVLPIEDASGAWFADQARNIKLNNQPLPYQADPGTSGELT